MNDSVLTLNPARRAILLITALLILPFVLAFGLYWLEWRPATLGNVGELIEPPRALPSSGLVGSDGNALKAGELLGKWTLVRVSPGQCDLACRDDLRQMRQVQVGLNKEMTRLRRVLMAGSAAQLLGDPALPDLARSYPDLVFVAPAAGSDGDAWRDTFLHAEQHFYVIDPLGNVMMRYPAMPDMQGMRKDLERLLKYSWVG